MPIHYRTVMLSGVVTLVLAISSQLELPDTALVPGTLQCLTIMLLGSFCGMRASILGGLLYVAGGALGIPWFSGMDSDMVTTGGYLVGFVPAITIIGMQSDRGNLSNYVSALGTFVVSICIIYLFGISWLITGVGMGYQEAIAIGMRPTLIGDIVEALFAAALVNIYHVFHKGKV